LEVRAGFNNRLDTPPSLLRHPASAIAPKWDRRRDPLARRKEPSIPDALLDQLLSGTHPRSAFDPDGLLHGLKKAFAE
jgi:hypothetical protein